MTDPHASEDSPAVDGPPVDGTATGTPVARSTGRSAVAPSTDDDRGRRTVAPSADVAPELHEVTDA